MRRLRRALTLALVVALAIAVGMAARRWCVGVVRVAGSSMSDTLIDGDVVLILRAGYAPARGDVVQCRFPGRGDTYIKRVVGLPGERIAFSGGELRVDGTPVSEPYVSSPTENFNVALGESEYLVLGDNRAESYDSRMADMGAIDPDAFMGRVMMILWPPRRIGRVD